MGGIGMFSTRPQAAQEENTGEQGQQGAEEGKGDDGDRSVDISFQGQESFDAGTYDGSWAEDGNFEYADDGFDDYGGGTGFEEGSLAESKTTQEGGGNAEKPSGGGFAFFNRDASASMNDGPAAPAPAAPPRAATAPPAAEMPPTPTAPHNEAETAVNQGSENKDQGLNIFCRDSATTSNDALSSPAPTATINTAQGAATSKKQGGASTLEQPTVSSIGGSLFDRQSNKTLPTESNKAPVSRATNEERTAQPFFKQRTTTPTIEAVSKPVPSKVAFGDANGEDSTNSTLKRSAAAPINDVVQNRNDAPQVAGNRNQATASSTAPVSKNRAMPTGLSFLNRATTTAARGSISNSAPQVATVAPIQNKASGSSGNQHYVNTAADTDTSGLSLSSPKNASMESNRVQFNVQRQTATHTMLPPANKPAALPESKGNAMPSPGVPQQAPVPNSMARHGPHVPTAKAGNNVSPVSTASPQGILKWGSSHQGKGPGQIPPMVTSTRRSNNTAVAATGRLMNSSSSGQTPRGNLSTTAPPRPASPASTAARISIVHTESSQSVSKADSPPAGALRRNGQLASPQLNRPAVTPGTTGPVDQMGATLSQPQMNRPAVTPGTTGPVDQRGAILSQPQLNRPAVTPGTTGPVNPRGATLSQSSDSGLSQFDVSILTPAKMSEQVPTVPTEAQPSPISTAMADSSAATAVHNDTENKFEEHFQGFLRNFRECQDQGQLYNDAMLNMNVELHGMHEHMLRQEGEMLDLDDEMASLANEIDDLLADIISS